MDNYKKFIEVMKNTPGEDYELMNYELNKSYYLPFDKLINKKTIAYETGRRKIDNYGVFLDIFTYHNMPNNKILRYFHYKRIKMYQNLIFGYSKTDLGKKHVFIKKMRKKISEIIGIKWILKKYNKVLTKYDKKDTKYMIISWPAYSRKKEILEKEWIKDYTFKKFDGIDAMICSGYDKMLTNVFGDYMTPPPKDKCVPAHGIEMYWRNENE